MSEAKVTKSEPAAPAVSKHGRLNFHGPTLYAALAVAFVLVLLLAYYLVKTDGGQHSSSYSRQTLKSNGYNYSFIFSKDAKVVKNGKAQTLSGSTPDKKQTLTVAAFPTPSVLADCGVIGDGWQKSFDISFEGKTSPVCTYKETSYVTVAEQGKTGHLITLATPNNQKFSDSVAKGILKSLQIRR